MYYIFRGCIIIPENNTSNNNKSDNVENKDIDVVFTNGAKPEDIGMSGKGNDEKKKDVNDNEKDTEKNTESKNESNSIEDEINEINENTGNPNDLTSIILKKLYYKIVIITHPDKSNIKNKRYIELFILAKKGYKERNILCLMNISDKLDINIIKCLSEAFKKIGEMIIVKNKLFNILEIQIRGLEDKINFKKKTFVWCWANADTSEKKEMIKQNLYQVWNLPDNFNEL